MLDYYYVDIREINSCRKGIEHNKRLTDCFTVELFFFRGAISKDCGYYGVPQYSAASLLRQLLFLILNSIFLKLGIRVTLLFPLGCGPLSFKSSLVLQISFSHHIISRHLVIQTYLAPASCPRPVLVHYYVKKSFEKRKYISTLVGKTSKFRRFFRRASNYSYVFQRFFDVEKLNVPDGITFRKQSLQLSR